MRIEDVLPTWHWRSAHAISVAASPQRTLDALRVVTSRDPRPLESMAAIGLAATDAGA